MSSLEVDIYAIILIIFTLVMIKRNSVFYHHKGTYFFLSCLITLLMIIMEVTDFELARHNFSNLNWLRYIVNAIGFGLCPLILYFLVLFCGNKLTRIKKWICVIPAIINMVIAFLSIYTGWIYNLKIGEYQRGPLFLFTGLVAILYIIILIIINLRENKRFARREFHMLLWSLLIVFFSSLIQMFFGEMHTIWPAASVGLFAYYVFIRDLQFEYDPMTELKNRSIYEKDLIEVSKREKVTIIVFDINNLKQINDSFGHSYGDDAIYEVAKVIMKTFEPIGENYRIGGDEFISLCSNIDDDIIKKVINSFVDNIKEINNNKKYDLVVPYGISYYYNKGGSIVEEIKQADKRMYKAKKEIKERECNKH